MSVFFSDSQQAFNYVPDIWASTNITLEQRNNIRSILQKIISIYKYSTYSESSNGLRRQTRKSLNSLLNNFTSTLLENPNGKLSQILSELNIMAMVCYKLTSEHSNRESMAQTVEEHFRRLACLLVGYDGFMQYPVFDIVQSMELFINGPAPSDRRIIENDIMHSSLES